MDTQELKQLKDEALELYKEVSDQVVKEINDKLFPEGIEPTNEKIFRAQDLFINNPMLKGIAQQIADIQALIPHEITVTKEQYRHFVNANCP